MTQTARVVVLREGLLKNKSGYPGPMDWNFDLSYQQESASK